MPPARLRRWALLSFAVTGWALLLLRAPQPASSGSRLPPLEGAPQARAPTLVVYVFSNSDAEYANNLRFFVEEAVKENDGCEYIIVLQEGDDSEPSDSLPPLPPNARYVRHANECFDIGTVGWVLNSELGANALRRYAYFVWLNSSVRGPFLPAYLRGRVHWTEPLLSKITRDTKLVGASINCGRAYDIPPAPHVQSYVVATDSVGLGVLLATGTVFKCWSDIRDTIIESEIGASKAMLAAGFGIDSLMLRYQGVDWLDPEVTQRACNSELNPLQPGFNDGINVEPLEVLFIKVKASFLAAGNWPHASTAVKYAQWLRLWAAEAAEHVSGASTHSSAWLDALAANEWPQRVAPALVAEARRRGSKCFDHTFYLDSSYDLAVLRKQPDPANLAWEHLISNGLNEGRPYRFTC